MAAVQAHHRLFLASTCAGQQRRLLRPSRIAAPCRAAVSGGVRTAQSPSSSSSGSGSPSSLRLNLDWVDPRIVAVPTSSPGAQVEVEKLRAIAEAAADRAEMHDIIGRQRDNWNHLLLHSNNSLALAASVMAALAPAAPTVVALKASAGVLLASAAVTMAAVNKIQPSQLAEEQRNATRLWRQLERDVRVTLALAAPVTRADVHDAMDRSNSFGSSSRRRGARGNGWTPELEEEMRGILRVIKAKDEHEYITVGKMVLGLNKGLAVAGPALAGTAAVAAAFIGSGEAGAWASGAAVLGGALAAAANTVEHGGQLGMVFELLRNCAGFYRKMQEEIEANLGEADVERREDGEVLETKVALQLGRSTSELKQFRRLASPSFKDDDVKDFAGKLF
uniref:F-box protein n=1 Tax=Oryza nivara TaxID=4536 RepID=A0A0E0G3Q6_ORYNI